MNVRLMTPTTVMRMHSALTQWEASTAPASLATLEMVSLAQVRYSTVMFSFIKSVIPMQLFSVSQ